MYLDINELDGHGLGFWGFKGGQALPFLGDIPLLLYQLQVSLYIWSVKCSAPAVGVAKW